MYSFECLVDGGGQDPWLSGAEDVDTLRGSHQLVRRGVPLVGIHSAGLNGQPEGYLALAQRFFRPPALGNVVADACDAVYAVRAVDGKEGDRDVSLTNLGKRDCSLESNDVAPEAFVECAFHLVKYAMQYLPGVMAQHFLFCLPVHAQMLAIGDPIAILAIDDRDNRVDSLDGFFVFV